MAMLSELKSSLPSEWYYSSEQYQRELQAVWYCDWVCAVHSSELSRVGDYRRVRIGDQQVIVTRNDAGHPRAFLNTCRHRGSVLCAKDEGRFANGRIVCPYHTWTYSLDGELLQTPHRIETDDFLKGDYRLYELSVAEWGGYVFVNFSPEPAESLQEFLGDEAGQVSNWPLEAMEIVHRERTALQCNWKLFWENYSECYHCPRLHPELCKIVPAYKEGILGPGDAPGWEPAGADDDGRAVVRDELRTWTLDGQSALPQIAGLNASNIADGMTFASFTASMYVVAHPDYVRTVRLLPTGPESVELIVDWLLMPGVKDSHKESIEPMLSLGKLVVEQDGRICELNQQGLHGARHLSGVLMPQEYELWEFHQWLRDKLGE